MRDQTAESVEDARLIAGTAGNEMGDLGARQIGLALKKNSGLRRLRLDGTPPMLWTENGVHDRGYSQAIGLERTEYAELSPR